jgi:multicomponent K+:H+ antiporter subunit C
MEWLVSSMIGLLTSTGIYLLLRNRTFPVILGLIFLTYAINLFLFASGGLAINQPPVIRPDATGYSDPVPQALVLTAIVISFGMTALIVVLSMRCYLETDCDNVSMPNTFEDLKEKS